MSEIYFSWTNLQQVETHKSIFQMIITIIIYIFIALLYSYCKRTVNLLTDIIPFTTA